MIEECNDEFFDYEFRTYHYCQLKKGHRGKHQSTLITRWTNLPPDPPDGDFGIRPSPNSPLYKRMTKK